MTARLNIAVDWSASNTPGPSSPSADQCWVGVPGEPARYFRTRATCTTFLIDRLRAHAGPAMVGFDFPLGYPSIAGTPTLPAGRELASMLSARVHDNERNRNNRFEVAARLNTEIADRFGASPFWGCTTSPPDGLARTKPDMGMIPEYRACELALIERGHRPQSCWKLAYPASVGSQTLTGMPAIHQLLEAFPERSRVWPFEQPTKCDDEITIAEIWPSLCEIDSSNHRIKDARQVSAACDAMSRASLAQPAHPLARVEGWIVTFS